MIKRFFTLALAASLVLVGCIANPDEYDPDYVITFSPAVSAIDGDVSDPSSVYPKSSTFGVWAFMLDNGKAWAESGNQASTWLDNATVTFSGDSWKTSDSKHWGATGEQLTFFAYSPSSLAVSFDKTSGLCLNGYNTLTDNTDLLYTDAIADIEKNLVLGSVAVPFKHAISKVCVNVMSNDAENTIIVKSVKIGDVFYKGDFHSQPAGWNLTADKTELEFCKTSVQLSSEAVSLATFNVLAQNQPRTVTITYDSFDEDGNPVDTDKTVTAKSITGKWSVGRQYFYTLDINTEEVSYKTDVLD